MPLNLEHIYYNILKKMRNDESSCILDSFVGYYTISLVIL